MVVAEINEQMPRTHGNNVLPFERHLTNQILPNGSGVAAGDIDGDGLADLFFAGLGGGSRLYRNLGSGYNSLEIRLIGTRSNRDAIGAKVSAAAGNRRIFKWVNGGNGFGCNNSRVVHLGLAREKQVNELQIQWPSGLRQSFQNIPAGQRVEIIEGGSSLRLLAKFRGERIHF